VAKNSPKTVLYLVDALGLGGKTKSLVDLALRLDPERYRPVVCMFKEEKGVLEDRLRQRGVPMTVVPCPDGVRPSMIGKIGRVLAQFRPDVVHCYNPRPIMYGGAAARLQRTRAIVGSLSAFACQVPDRTYTFLPQKLATASMRNVYRNRMAAKLVHRMVTVSRPLGERFFRYNGLSLNKLRIVSYGVDVCQPWKYSPQEIAGLRAEMGIQPGDVVVGSVGRLVEQKDYPTQFRAFALAVREVPELRMVLAGEGPLRESLERLAEELRIGDKVRFLGLWERVPLLMRSLDIFVLASKFEPYGVVLLEAKAAGPAIAATRVNEVADIVNDGKTALLAEPENPESLADVFVRLAKSAELRQRLGWEAAESARRDHSIEAMVDGYQSIYDELLGAR
jgi:glycosyltransferase involved in cell wall biosynthesis